MIPSTYVDARRRIAARVLGAAILLGSLPARAEPSPRDPVTAEVLFRAGRDLLAEGNYVEGCPKFEGKLVEVELSLVKRAAPPEDDAPRSGVPAWAWVTGGAGLVLGGGAAFFLADDLAAIRALRANCHEGGGKVYCAPEFDPAPDNARKNRDLGLSGRNHHADTDVLPDLGVRCARNP